MDMPIEPRIERDPDHPCPICGAETELVSETFTSWDDAGIKNQVEVTSRRRRCAALDCPGHADGLDEPAEH
jgi:hypothetical protein